MEETEREILQAFHAGVNYYDTAQPYHGGLSEVAIGKSLSRFPRDSWYLADKYPGHQNVPGVKELLPDRIKPHQSFSREVIDKHIVCVRDRNYVVEL